MPAMLSKLMARNGALAAAATPQNLSRAFVAAVCLTYGVKVAYPLLEQLVNKPNRQHDSVNNNLAPVLPKAASLRSRIRKNIPALNFTFILQFLKLARIMIPTVFCQETALLAGHTTFLFLRTFLSIYVATLEGAIVKHIVRKEPQHFARQLAKWFGVAVPATFINSMIKYLESRIALSFRTRLVDHSYQLYFTNQSYYRVTVLDGRLENCAQRLTDDIEIVANTVSHLYGQITKPLFDILLMAFALANLTRSRNANIVTGPILISCVVALSALILRLVSPRFGHLVAQEAEKKGYLRHVHTRLATNAEEIAFYGGQKVELSHLRNAYRMLCQHMEHMFGVKLWFVMLEQFLMKYVWSGAGMVVVSLPILLSAAAGKGGVGARAGRRTQHAARFAAHVAAGDQPVAGVTLAADAAPSDDSVSERTQYFTTAKNLLLTGGNAVERLMSSYKDVVELAGHTARVANMFQVLEEVANAQYSKTVVQKDVEEEGKEGFAVRFRGDQPVARGQVIYTTSNEIVLKNVPIVTPNCDVVCPALSLRLQPGEHLLITGPNGCGKSSLFRILSGLWPIYDGELHAPRNSMFYIPQRPYMVIGNLRDQIIYPDTAADMINKQVREEDLREIMKMAHLEHIVERDGFAVCKDWTDILSGGEKQRMAIARLFYHKPRYALLDECTSAVSIDVESSIYQLAIDLGITLLTITHRPTLWKFHTHILQFDGTGGWECRPLDADDRIKLKMEKEQLLHAEQTKAAGRRLAELNRLLGE